tara:strand:- start:404 stop:568 length:165 start_codon:yes stop_codon:yes gene_type:complete
VLAIGWLIGLASFPILIVVTFHLARKNGRTLKKVSGFTFSAEFEDPEKPGANHN